MRITIETEDKKAMEVLQKIIKIYETQQNFDLAPSLTSKKIMEAKEEGIELEDQIKVLLKKIGIPINLSGYIFLIDAIKYCIDEGNMVSVTKELYPYIGKKFNKGPEKIERAIRNAIEIVWERGNKEALKDIFGETISEKNRPTNSLFIMTIADLLK